VLHIEYAASVQLSPGIDLVDGIGEM